MIQDCNIPCKYSAHVLEFDDGTKLEGIDPGIRTPFGQPFVITSYSDEGPFTNPMLDDLLFDGEEPTQYGCQICGHYADKEDIIKLFCNDINPLKGIDKRPEREVVTVESDISLDDALSIITKSGLKVVKENYDRLYDKAKRITQIIYDNVEEVTYSDAEDIGDYLAEKIVEQDMDREEVAETLEQMLDDCGIRISFDLSTHLASKIIVLD